MVIVDGRIASVGTASSLPADVTTIDGAGCTLLPGLTDAHVHLALIGRKGDHGSDAWIMHVLAVAQVIEGALQEGFTTVRDAGGLEPTWAARGRVRRARGAAHPTLGVTHLADRRSRRRPPAPRGPPRRARRPGLVAGLVVADGADEVRKAAREQLRRGATQIKLMASGGIINPTDPFEFAAAVGG